MTRPDQKKFDQFCEPLIKYDYLWREFESNNNFTLEINPLRKPGRILRKKEIHKSFKMTYIICLYLEPIWFKVKYSNDLPYTFALCAFYDDLIDKKFRWKIDVILVENQPLDIIGEKLFNYLEQSFFIIESWSPSFVKSQGEKIEFSEIFYDR